MAQGNSSNQSDMFSDHPSDAKRIAAIKADMPEALKYYKPATTTTTATKSTATKTTTSSKHKTTHKSTKKTTRK